MHDVLRRQVRLQQLTPRDDPLARAVDAELDLVAVDLGKRDVTPFQGTSHDYALKKEKRKEGTWIVPNSRPQP